MSEKETIKQLNARQKARSRIFMQGIKDREKDFEERQQKRREERQSRTNNFRYRESSFPRSSEVHGSESFRDIEELGEPELDREKWYLRFQIMSDNHYPINSRARARQLLNMKPDEVVLNKQFKFGLLRIMHPDKSEHPNSTRFFQMLTDAIDIIENRGIGSGKRNRKTNKRHRKTHKRYKSRKNRSRKY